MEPADDIIGYTQDDNVLTDPMHRSVQSSIEIIKGTTSKKIKQNRNGKSDGPNMFLSN